MRIAFTVEMEVNRISGKFASKDDIADAIQSELEQAADAADVSSVGPDGDSEYEITDVSVERTT